MSTTVWRAGLQDLLKITQPDPQAAPRLAVVGIGNEQRADDAAGVLAARGIDRRIREGNVVRVCALEGGPAPENVTGALRQFNPAVIVLIDAADMRAEPGSIRWIGLDEIDGLSASTHSLPLSMFARYLALELGCEVRLLGIQPLSIEWGGPVSLATQGAIAAVVEEFCNALN